MTKEKEMKESEEQQATLHLNAASEACEERVIVIPELGMGANDYATFGKDLKGLELEDEGLEPFDIFGRIHPGQFDLELLPKVLKDFIEDEADRMGTDPGMLAMFVISAVATVLNHQLQIQVKEFDPTWKEAPRLWIAVVALPSTKKSPTQNVAFKPVRIIEAREHQIYQKKLKGWEEATAGMKKGGEKPPVPVHKRITIADATVEKIADILNEQESRGITSVQDELSGWLSGMDAYKGNGIHKDRAAWLTAYTGGYWSVDRISRGSTFIENWSISVVGGIQPTVLHSYLKASNHDGMLPRFLIYNGESAPVGADRVPNYQAINAYNSLIEDLYIIQPENPVIISKEGHRIRKAFFEELKELQY